MRFSSQKVKSSSIQAFDCISSLKTNENGNAKNKKNNKRTKNEN